MLMIYVINYIEGKELKQYTCAEYHLAWEFIYKLMRISKTKPGITSFNISFQEVS